MLKPEATMNTFQNYLNIREHIRKVGDKWEVTNKSGTKVLGTHDTEKDAEAQLQAIEISKHKD
ncbi:hypothetical protein 2050H1_030 [Serratia phage 2050H1]|uniref:Uncharacterized protein n=1 Tax=Serratia phage 2050H1 TaxID=2024250 RepID=A0A249Y289_9CAUD|nr:hypothetical protein 2050H1_030 [Serratia phage 2050H1]